MRYTPGTNDEVFASIEAVVKGLDMSLVELSVSPCKSGVQVRAVIYKRAKQGADVTRGVMSVSIDDCARVHRAIIPRLELAFPKRDIHVEVSSPGIERKIKDGAEFVHYVGRPVSCYRTDISDWTSCILVNTDDTHIVIKGKNG
ncbi:MAG: ribosome assembly cofactor RimP, partial [Spirochaetaceae bacterium]|nr:ribosome assembly cofactor RimP [Spirochaetaceae bacterium]